MSYITRLTWNSKDWNLPSGFSNKSVKNENYEADSGFGWEEWLFNSNHVLNGYQYGFIQCFTAKSHRGKIFTDLHLYTRKIELNGNATLLYVGMIKKIEVLSLSDPHHSDLISHNKARMRKELANTNAKLKFFDKEKVEIGKWFNVRFKASDVEFNKNYKTSNLPINLTNFRLMYKLQNIGIDAQTLNTLKAIRK
jgi:hypothetical protein